MRRHHPAGTFVAAALAILALALIVRVATGCYHCDGPNCANLPCPTGDPGPCLDKRADAGRD